MSCCCLPNWRVYRRQNQAVLAGVTYENKRQQTKNETREIPMKIRKNNKLAIDTVKHWGRDQKDVGTCLVHES